VLTRDEPGLTGVSASGAGEIGIPGNLKQVTWRVIENSIRRSRDRWLRGRNQETC
jgi:hypothetical protein